MKIETAKRGTVSSGRTQLIRYLEGRKITRSGGMAAKCFECMGGYVDGRVDCKISDCPLYPWMPYQNQFGGNLTP